jgi:hypothetical protein
MSERIAETMTRCALSAASSLVLLCCASLPKPDSDCAESPRWPYQPVLMWKEGAVTDAMYPVRPSPPPTDACRGDERGTLSVPARDLCDLQGQLVLYLGPEVDSLWFEVLETHHDRFVVVPHGRVSGCAYRMPNPPVCFSGITVDGDRPP